MHSLIYIYTFKNTYFRVNESKRLNWVNMLDSMTLNVSFFNLCNA